jgi:hypothetical protein
MDFPHVVLQSPPKAATVTFGEHFVVPRVLVALNIINWIIASSNEVRKKDETPSVAANWAGRMEALMHSVKWVAS